VTAVTPETRTLDPDEVPAAPIGLEHAAEAA
jgi:hypothetical protein